MGCRPLSASLRLGECPSDPKTEAPAVAAREAGVSLSRRQETKLADGCCSRNDKLTVRACCEQPDIVLDLEDALLTCDVALCLYVALETRGDMPGGCSSPEVTTKSCSKSLQNRTTWQPESSARPKPTHACPSSDKPVCQIVAKSAKRDAKLVA
eukprot:TRINITY_DN81483_c0_g1_i1.p2 TRINITY_DN81483_c0_g1~~TRINITY_DN81483_c0_g1_i1.p2  ORF type:complete len:154 (-),score=28.36 TRINITY_DN81483_c0_g1_i1:213-674(-)